MNRPYGNSVASTPSPKNVAASRLMVNATSRGSRGSLNTGSDTGGAGEGSDATVATMLGFVSASTSRPGRKSSDCSLGTMVKGRAHFEHRVMEPMLRSGARTPPRRQYGHRATIVVMGGSPVPKRTNRDVWRNYTPACETKPNGSTGRTTQRAPAEAGARVSSDSLRLTCSRCRRASCGGPSRSPCRRPAWRTRWRTEPGPGTERAPRRRPSRSSCTEPFRSTSARRSSCS